MISILNCTFRRTIPYFYFSYIESQSYFQNEALDLASPASAWLTKRNNALQILQVALQFWFGSTGQECICQIHIWLYLQSHVRLQMLSMRIWMVCSIILEICILLFSTLFWILLVLAPILFFLILNQNSFCYDWKKMISFLFSTYLNKYHKLSSGQPPTLPHHQKRYFDYKAHYIGSFLTNLILEPDQWEHFFFQMNNSTPI